jgi:ABC-type polysaccharide/polyol phosphate export permease
MTAYNPTSSEHLRGASDLHPAGMTQRASEDILGGLSSWRLWSMLGWLDIRQRYRRSMLGAFWLTISMGVMVVALGALYSSLFQIDAAEFLPFMAAGLTVWGFLSAVLGDGTAVFIAAEGIIKQGGIPLSIHLYRILWRNLIVLAHNLTVLPLVYLWFGTAPSWSILLFFPGILLVLANLFWMLLILGPLCTRFRDLPPVVMNGLQLLFFLSPIIYKPELLAERYGFFLDWNPFNHLIEVVRAPLLGQVPQTLSYVVLVGMAVIGGAVSWAFFRRFRGRVAYWL